MYLPSSTYRLQFNKDFTFKDLGGILSYLSSLGSGAIYSSPVFKSVPVSNHGYDVTDPLQFNPEIGTYNQFAKIRKVLGNKKIGWIQDIVPNHMAFHPDNPWLMDVLKMGRSSKYAGFFDIDWNHPVYENKIMVPIMSESLENAIDDGKVALKTLQDELFVLYGGFRLPVNRESLNGTGTNHDRERLCSDVNNDPALLKSLMSDQHYVLAPWYEVDRSLNYRRFFTINGLISLRMEDPIVFDKYHELIFRLVDEGWFSGLRLDHTDGLERPLEYFDRLRARVGDEPYIVAEKILESEEKPDQFLPLQGTTGYDFMAMVNGLLTGSGIRTLISFYLKTTHTSEESEEVIYRSKLNVLNTSFQGDLDNICRNIKDSGLITSSEAIHNLKEALGEFMVCCPFYRLYSDQMPPYDEDVITILKIMDQALIRKPYLKSSLKALKELFLKQGNDTSKAINNIFHRIMQYTGPLMAKGVEDTAMYSWVPLISHNEVGDSIGGQFVTTAEFHEKMKERRSTFPASLNASSTHDTKRGEDTRARLSVISDIPDDWKKFYKHWSLLARKHVVRRKEKNVPDENEQYFICQVILGGLPMEGKHDRILCSRIGEYLRKSLREAKVNSNWNQPDTEYENLVVNFATNLLNDRELEKFRKTFFQKLRDFGIINSLSQLILKGMCPGIPDFYQGTEFWDLSFVDPDNRRPVDYVKRAASLNSIMKDFKKGGDGFFSGLFKERFSGGIKLWMTQRIMQERHSDPEAFVNAGYIPLEVTGYPANQLLAFARTFKDKWYVVIIPLHFASLTENNSEIGNSRIRLPLHAPHAWTDLWDDRSFESTDGYLAGNVLRFNCPVILKGLTHQNSRASGILMHVTSLPGKQGTGSLGQEAKEFIDLLNLNGQKYWQILPVNPVGTGYSPYSSPSAFAGNTLFIDPELLYRQHRIRKLPVSKTSERVDFSRATKIRNDACGEAFEYLNKTSRILFRKKFDSFCMKNEDWIDDFALFTSIQKQYPGEWRNWPSSLRNREKKALNEFRNKFQTDIELSRFIQYLFHEQFSMVKNYAESFGIKIIGDIPIYVAYNSADVWAHPELFNLDSKGKMITVAGVPPDYFSSDGQLWNMPIYNWKVIKEQNYTWWKQRIRRNLEYCDLLRIDHFRALSAYWEVPSKDRTARNGRWTRGPGDDFLTVLKSEFQGLPFIAEDLGDIDEDVLKLRDRFGLPGMRVLMFAFDKDMPKSFYIPHNFNENSVVYTGTHDNNTVTGWYKECEHEVRNRLTAYLGKKSNLTSISWDLIRLAMESVSKMALLPVQDILGYDEKARLNTPARKKGNWRWKLKDFDEVEKSMKKLLELTYYSGRIS